MGERIYPDYIGGLYIDSNDNLIIQIVEQNIPDSRNKMYRTYESITNVDNNTKKEYVDYPYEQLQEIYDVISNDFLGKVDNLIGLYIDVISNRVVVELEELTAEKIEEFKKNVINSPMIIFDKATMFKQISTVNPGAGFISSSGNGCSYGYRARTARGQTGVVTAGHCFSGKGDSIPSVGSVTQYSNGGSLDAAFVENTSGATLSNEIVIAATGATIPLSYFFEDVPLVGEKVSKYGKTTGLTSGVINAANYS